MHEMTPRSLLALGSTCRRLLYLSRDPDLWTSMTIDWQAIKDQEENKNKHLDSALRRATKLQRLTIKNRTFEQIKRSLMNDGEAGIVFFDFTDALGSVDRSKLLYKLGKNFNILMSK